MGVIIPVGYGQVKMKWGLIATNVEAVSTFGVDCDVSAAPLTNATAINNILIASGRPMLPANYSTSWNYLGMELTQMSPTGPQTGVVDATTPGTTSLSTTPPNVAFLMRKNTARGGRKGRGRCFLPPIWISEANVGVEGALNNTNLTALNVLWSAVLTALATASIPAVLLHSDGSTPDVITSWFVDAIVATQRRRLRR